MANRILLVDDKTINLTIFERLLAHQGYTLLRATGGEEALATIARERPDLVLLDVNMPGLDGIEVLTRLRHEEVGHVPVILVTGQADSASRLRGFEAGADDFLEKPIDRQLLLVRVRTLLRLKNATDDLASRNATLERLQREQREMTAFIVHDLRSPLSVVHMNLGWVASHVDTQGTDVAEALADALESSTRLAKMIEDLLAIAHLEQGEVPLARAAVDTDDLLRQVARDHRREADASQIAISVSGATGLSVNADATVLQRVLENLVRNALQYAPRGGRIELGANLGKDVAITVSNTGSPVPAEEQGQIFEKFKRGAKVSSRSGNAGLGLYFCARAMEAHGGSIGVTESAEWPVSFVLHLPAA